MAVLKFMGHEIDVGGGTLFMSLIGLGEVYAEAMTNADDPKPFEIWVTETGSTVINWGKWNVVLSPWREQPAGQPL